MSSLIFSGALTGAFQASDAFTPGEDGQRVTLFFDLVVDAGGASVEWYLESTGPDQDPNIGTFRREVAQEDQGGGVVDMPVAVRNFQQNGGGDLPVGTHNLSVELVRSTPYSRVQIRAASGAVSDAKVTIAYGVKATV